MILLKKTLNMIKTKYDTDKLELENKIPSFTNLVKKQITILT